MTLGGLVGEGLQRAGTYSHKDRVCCPDLLQTSNQDIYGGFYISFEFVLIMPRDYGMVSLSVGHKFLFGAYTAKACVQQQNLSFFKFPQLQLKTSVAHW